MAMKNGWNFCYFFWGGAVFVCCVLGYVTFVTTQSYLKRVHFP